jgi:lipopolysaccharide/colanic/teichoic acid biosynthesis glycosyltransferase
MFKRIFDIAFSLIAIIILLPLFIVIALYVWIDSEGGVFYRQTRVGKNNKDFKLFKFRTMHINADKLGLLTIGNNDNRITKAGYWLRKYKIDEMPQVINVFIGDMSFVGPRPEVRKYVNLYNQQQLSVLSIRPGITDWASIEFRNENEVLAGYPDPEAAYIDIVMPRKLFLNMEYIKKRSVILDVKIILKTLSKIINP